MGNNLCNNVAVFAILGALADIIIQSSQLQRMIATVLLFYALLPLRCQRVYKAVCLLQADLCCRQAVVNLQNGHSLYQQFLFQRDYLSAEALKQLSVILAGWCICQLQQRLGLANSFL